MDQQGQTPNGSFLEGIKPYPAANIQMTKRVAQALQRGHRKRVLFLSYVGADASSANLYLQTKGQLELTHHNLERESPTP